MLQTRFGGGGGGGGGGAPAAPLVEWDPRAPYFFLVPRAAVLACDAALPRMQTLRDEGKLVRKQIDLAAAFAGEGIVKQLLFVSHRWEEKGVPDVKGEQLKAMQAYLRAEPTVEYVWYDFSCMAQKESEDVDGRTPTEKEEFSLMLAAIADLYLTSRVLILLDKTYPTRFWTLTEAWCSMKTPTAEGVRTAAEAERRYAIRCIHNADEAHDMPALIKLLSEKTPHEMHDILDTPDVHVTNTNDKKVMLPFIKKTNEHVKGFFAAEHAAAREPGVAP